MKDQVAEATSAAVAQKVACGGGGVGFFGGLTGNEITVFGGLFAPSWCSDVSSVSIFSTHMEPRRPSPAR